MVEVNSDGAEDEPYLRNASIKVNGIERCPMGRGMNIVLLDNAGNYLLSKNFDTADPQIGPSEGYKMKLFLDNLPSGRIVCLSSLENVGKLSSVKQLLCSTSCSAFYTVTTRTDYFRRRYERDCSRSPSHWRRTAS